MDWKLEASIWLSVFSSSFLSTDNSVYVLWDYPIKLLDTINDVEKYFVWFLVLYSML